ncbi:MAG: class I SAM-dependent methyltransferase [Candidatus Aminicenantes bacterium]|jgi:2-polyprenyl-6-hydroxyphenyl methylase/3-demethylubiquinone-9 3-methyltransferase
MIDKKALLEHYREAGFITRTYLKIKLKICPLLKLEEIFPREGTIVDLGCGNGLFPNILCLGSSERQIIGLDLDKKKIEVANATKILSSQITYQIGDVVEGEYPQGDVFALVDVLYLIPYQRHEPILRKCYISLPPGGTLIIKEMDTRPRWKYAWNLFQETLAVKLIGFTLGERFYFRNQKDYLDILQRIGYSVETVPVHSGYWYPHIAYICTK